MLMYCMLCPVASLSVPAADANVLCALSRGRTISKAVLEEFRRVYVALNVFAETLKKALIEVF